jgi:hypothetical protein
MVFVYGTGNASTTGVNLLVAEAMAAPRGGADYAYPVITDREYLDHPVGGTVPIVIGNCRDNAVLSKWNGRLPLTVQGPTIQFANRKFSGDKLGAIFVYPNPDDPRHVAGVVTAPTPEGLWQSLSLPTLIPDFMIYDAQVTPACGEPILGKRGRVLAAGFFNSDWSSPESTNDPLDSALP